MARRPVGRVPRRKNALGADPVGRVPRRENAAGADPAHQRAQSRSGASPRPVPPKLRRSEGGRDAERVLDSSEASLLDIVDNVLNKGVVLSGDLTIALAQVDLVYARLSLLLCAADRVLPNEDTDLMERHHDRRQRRAARLRPVGSQRDPTPSSTAGRSALADRPGGQAEKSAERAPRVSR